MSQGVVLAPSDDLITKHCAGKVVERIEARVGVVRIWFTDGTSSAFGQASFDQSLQPQIDAIAHGMGAVDSE